MLNIIIIIGQLKLNLNNFDLLYNLFPLILEFLNMDLIASANQKLLVYLVTVCNSHGIQEWL